jgi:hypothetical protein
MRIMTATTAETFGARVAGARASRPKALLVSLVAGGAVSIAAYRWLRS